jgi:4-amino-4-deoxy-L-arabinose transferase-like glycosyltransferase
MKVTTSPNSIKAIHSNPISASNGKILYISSVCLQTLWLLSIWLTGTVDSVDKLFPLLLYTLCIGFILYFTPENWLKSIPWQVNNKGEKQLTLLAIAIVLVGVIYSIYQKFQALVAEGSVYNASLVIARKGIAYFFKHYEDMPWLGIQHPPLVPILNGIAMQIAGEGIIVVRLLSLLFGLATAFVVYALGKELRDTTTGLLAAISFTLFPYFFRLSAAASNDIQVTFFSSLTLLMTFRLLRSPTSSTVLIGGFSLAAGLLAKYTLLLLYPVLFFLYFFDSRFKSVRRPFTLLLLVSGTIFSAWLACGYAIGIYDLQITTLSKFAGAQTSTPWAKWMFLEFITTRLPSALGLYNIPFILLGLVYLGRALKDFTNRFIFIWISIFFVAFSLTLPDARYCMPAFPALAILMADSLVLIRQYRSNIIWLLIANCASTLYLFVDWHRSSHLFIGELLNQMP